MIPPVQRIIIDGMNVIGSRPDGWWRDRNAAAARLVDRLRPYAAVADAEVTLVLDGASFADFDAGDHAGVHVMFARDAGFATADDLIVTLVQDASDPAIIELITSDRALRKRVLAEGANYGSPRALLEQLDVQTE